MASVTTIPLSPEVRNKLRASGDKGETYNDILRRLIGDENMTWENDKELMNESKFVRFSEGVNTLEFNDDGEKCRIFGKAGVEFKVTQGEDEKILSVRPGPVLDVIREAKKEHSTLVGHTLTLKREGTTKEDTKYSEIEVR